MIDYIKDEILNYFKSDCKFAKNILIFTSNGNQRSFINNEIRNLMMYLFRNIQSEYICGIVKGRASFNYNGGDFCLSVVSAEKSCRVSIRVTTPNSNNLDGVKVKNCVVYGTEYQAEQMKIIFDYIHIWYCVNDKFETKFINYCNEK